MLMYVIIALIVLLAVFGIIIQKSSPSETTPTPTPIPPESDPDPNSTLEPPPLPSEEELAILGKLEEAVLESRSLPNSLDINNYPIHYCAYFIKYQMKHRYTPSEYNQNKLFAFACILVRTNYRKDDVIADEMNLLVDINESTWEKKLCRLLIIYIWYRYCTVHYGIKDYDALLIELKAAIKVPKEISIIALSRGIRWIYLLAKLGNNLKITSEVQQLLLNVVENNIGRCNWCYIHMLYGSDVRYLTDNTYDLDINEYFPFLYYQKNLANKYPPSARYPTFTLPLPSLSVYQKDFIKYGFFVYPYAEMGTIHTAPTLQPIPSTFEWTIINENMYVEKTCGLTWQIVTEPTFYVYCGGYHSYYLPQFCSKCFVLKHSVIVVKSVLNIGILFYVVFLSNGTLAMFLLFDYINNYMDICIVDDSIRNNFNLVSMSTSVTKNSLSKAENWEQFSTDFTNEQIHVFTQSVEIKFRRVVEDFSNFTNIYIPANNSPTATYRILRTGKDLTDIDSQQKTLTAFGVPAQSGSDGGYTVMVKQMQNDDKVRFSKHVKFSQNQIQIIDDFN